MPTNLPPEYHEAERRFREADTPREKSAALEEVLKTIPKHKGTDKLRADLRKKLSKYKSLAQAAKKKIGKHESLFHIDKEGNARIIVLGCANVGKSSLVSLLTHASPDISASPYSTWSPTPGMMDYKGVQLQLLDTPALDREFMEPELAELIKSTDLVLLMLDLQAFPIDQFLNSLNILEKSNIYPKHKNISETNSHKTILPFVVVVNKDDGPNLDAEFDVLNELLRDEGWILLPVSIEANRNINQMMDFIVKELRLIRVYAKKPHEEPDYSKPFVLKAGESVENFAEKVHKDFLLNLKSARVWGKGVRDGQPVGREHVLHDGDIVELHI